MKEKMLHDMRGSQWRMFRLARFDAEGLLHMVSYRLSVPVMLALGAVLLVALAYPSLAPSLGMYEKYLAAVTWLLITPQIFEVVKGFALMASRGMAFGHLDESYVNTVKRRYPKYIGAFVALPFAFLAAWAALFVAMMLWWIA